MEISKTTEGWIIDRKAAIDLTYRGKKISDMDLAEMTGIPLWDIERMRKKFQHTVDPIIVYFSVQAHGFFNKGLTLKEVITKIGNKELTPKNTLTIRRWAQYVVPNLLTRAFHFDKEGFDKKDSKNYESLALQHTIDFPAWGLVEDEHGRLFVGARDKDYIGVMDHRHFLETGKIRYAEDLKFPFGLSDLTVHHQLFWYHPPNSFEKPSKEEDICAAIEDIILDQNTGLFLSMRGIPPDPKKGDYDNIPDRNIPRIWASDKIRDKEIHPLVMGAPTLTMSGGGDRYVTMNNIANNRPADPRLGVIKVKYI